MDGNKGAQGESTMLAWKPNWEETKQHFVDWWNREWLVLSVGTPPQPVPHEVVAEPAPASLVEAYEDGVARAERNHFHLASEQA